MLALRFGNQLMTSKLLARLKFWIVLLSRVTQTVAQRRCCHVTCVHETFLS